MRLETVLAAHAERYPQKTAIICDGVQVSYGELQHLIRYTANGLFESGLRNGDRIVLYLPNGLELVQLLYAAYTLGAIAVPVTTRLTIREVSEFCQDCDAKILAFHKDQGPGLADLLKQRSDMTAVVVGGNSPGAISFANSWLSLFIKNSKAHGIRKIIKLNVSGAFHSHLMKNARIYLEKFIKSIKFHDTNTPIYQNVFPKKNFISKKN